MKKLFFSLVVFSALLIIGCQENSITDPVTAADANKTSASPVSGTVQLKASLYNPSPMFNAFFTIEGQVSYQANFLDLDPIPSSPQQAISLYLNIDAQLSSYTTLYEPPNNQVPAGIISEESNDTYVAVDDNLFYIIKTYRIQKRDDGMVLKCIFIVRNHQFSVETMWLEMSAQDRRIAVSD